MSTETVSDPLVRGKRDRFKRLAFAAVTGVILSHLLPFENGVFVGFFPVSILLGLDVCSLRRLFGRCMTLLGGMICGTLVYESFADSPILAVVVTYIVFLSALKLFSVKYHLSVSYFFIFSYVLSTINASYPGVQFEISVMQYYLIQLGLVFTIVWGAFVLFPAEIPTPSKGNSLFSTPVPVHEMMIYALVWLGVWIFFMMFEWRFALFAFLSFMAAFRQFDRETMKRIAMTNVRIHILACSGVSVFSLILFGLAGNWMLFALGVVLIMIPVTYRAVYPRLPSDAYANTVCVSAVMIPLILYISPEHAAVYQSMLRASLIVFLMAILWLVIEWMYHGTRTAKRVRRLPRRVPRLLGTLNTWRRIVWINRQRSEG